MKDFNLTLFLFTIWWSIVSASVEDNSALERQNTNQATAFKENDLNADTHMVNTTHDTVDHSQDFFYVNDLKKICDAQVNEFDWKYLTIRENEEKNLNFRLIDKRTHSSTFTWYLKNINEIDIIEMYPKTYKHQIQFHINIEKQIISLSRLYPTFPEISGFAIIQFITNLAFACEFVIDVFDVADISMIYAALYGKRYYEYHFKGINLNEKFLFEKIIVKKEIFLDCYKNLIKGVIKNLSQLFYENIQLCENASVSVEFCPITFDTHYIFYRKSFQQCIDWLPIGGFPIIAYDLNLRPQHFEISSEDIIRINNMKKKKQSTDNISFEKIHQALDLKIIKTYDEIKIQIFDTSFLMKLFSNIFEFCFIELEKQKSNPNPEDIFKLYLRPCVIPSINLFLQYYTNCGDENVI